MNQHIKIKCPDGFANQIRLALAANYLVSIGEAKTAQQEWVVNKDNIVNYDKFFKPLPFVKFGKVDDDASVISTQSFCRMIKHININQQKHENILKTSFRYLHLKEFVSKIIENFVRENNISDSIGVHVRTGCKTALLNRDPNRNTPTDHNIIIDQLLKQDRTIFLATDNKETQDTWKSTFGNRLIVFQDIVSGQEYFDANSSMVNGRFVDIKRHTSDLHVIADMFILLKCYSFIGSNESSFSIMINWLRQTGCDKNLLGYL